MEAILAANRAGESVERYRALLAGLPGVDAVPSGLDFRGLTMQRPSVFRQLDLSGSDFSGARLAGGFSECVLDRANLSALRGRNLSLGHCRCRYATLKGTRLPGAQLWETDLHGADLSHSVLTGARLNGASLCEAVLVGTDLRRAWAANADLRGADLRAVDATAATFGGAQFDAETLVAGATFSREGLDAPFADHIARAGGSTGAVAAQAHALAEIDAALAILERDGAPERLCRAVADARAELTAGAGESWLGALRARLSPAQLAQVIDAATRGIRELP